MSELSMRPTLPILTMKCTCGEKDENALTNDSSSSWLNVSALTFDNRRSIGLDVVHFFSSAYGQAPPRFFQQTEPPVILANPVNI